jgi:hypothetical protein
MSIDSILRGSTIAALTGVRSRLASQSPIPQRPLPDARSISFSEFRHTFAAMANDTIGGSLKL